MKITHGLMEGQVLQRDAEGRATALIVGTSRSEGTVEIRVLQGRKVMKGYAWYEAGVSADKYFYADLEGLRVGGPYTIEFRIRKGRKKLESAAVCDVYVGDVWILAGQSNMEGVGNLIHAPKPNHRVRAFYMRDEWDVAEEPIHFLSEAVDTAHNDYGRGKGRPSRAALARMRRNQVKGMSPGHVFALDMLKRTRVPQGLIACAHGGTSMEEWSPGLRRLGSKSFYGAMMRRYEKLGQPVAGILWYQGESDANPDAAKKYTERMVDMVASTRSDMGLPGLPWVIVQLGCHAAAENDFCWNSIQEQQRRLPDLIPNLDVAPAIDLELDDGIHIGGRSHLVLGKRMARLADRLVHGNKRAKAGIRVGKVEIIRTPESTPPAACCAVKITYTQVAGKLVSDGRPSGFTLVDRRGEDLRGIFKTILKGSSVILCSNMTHDMLATRYVTYGHGRLPFCNITDSEGMSLPAMQGLPIAPDHAPWVEDWKVVRLSSSLSRLTPRHFRAARGWKKAPRRQGFGLLPKQAKDSRTGLYGFKTFLTAKEPLDAQLVFGANAPFKLWVNGKMVMRDGNCTMPINNPRYVSDVPLKRGRNEILVGFATKDAGEHIGICAKIGNSSEKRDVRISC